MNTITEFTLAPLQAADRRALHELLIKTAAFREEEVAVALELFDCALGPSASAENDYELVGAFDERTLAGYACYGPTPATDGTYDLYWIAVHPTYQGSGAGSALLNEIEERLQARRARMIVIETSARDGYDATRRFYAARGYGVAARIREFYAPADDRVVLTKQLASSPFPA